MQNIRSVRTFPDPTLMSPIDLLPDVAIKYIKNRGIDSTNMLGVKNINRRNTINDKRIENGELLQDTIISATLIMNIPHDKRFEANNNNTEKSWTKKQFR